MDNQDTFGVQLAVLLSFIPMFLHATNALTPRRCHRGHSPPGARVRPVGEHELDLGMSDGWGRAGRSKCGRSAPTETAMARVHARSPSPVHMSRFGPLRRRSHAAADGTRQRAGEPRPNGHLTHAP